MGATIFIFYIRNGSKPYVCCERGRFISSLLLFPAASTAPINSLCMNAVGLQLARSQIFPSGSGWKPKEESEEESECCTLLGSQRNTSKRVRVLLSPTVFLGSRRRRLSPGPVKHEDTSVERLTYVIKHDNVKPRVYLGGLKL